MSNKITEEQYQKIVEIGDDFEENGGLGILDTLNQKTIGDVLFLTELASKIEFYPNKEIIAAIANPITREWAHDQFVEKEKKYYWKRNGLYLTKDNFDGSIIFDSYKSLFTESEIVFWGYNPEMFDKEEVQ